MPPIRSIRCLVAVAAITATVVVAAQEGSWADLKVSGRAPTACRDRIVFQTDRDGNDEIYSMNADGTDVTRLTDDPAIDANPALSPDGERVVFVSYRSGAANLFVMDADGSGVERLTTGPQEFNPGWSPDGTRIVYAGLIGSDFELMMMNADGSGQHAITDNASLDAQPDWSPDGRRIAFNRTTGSG